MFRWAISCSMLRRALLAVAVLSYLICVLVLSGGQKDELRGKITNQLGNYNVDVKKLFNNEDLYKNCRNNSNAAISESLLNTSAFQNVIKHLHDLSNDVSSRKIIDKYKNNKTEATETDKVIIARDKRTAVTNNLDDHTTFLLEPKLKYADNGQDFHNVISFWQRFGNKNDKTITDNPIQNQKKNKTISNFLNNTNNEYFSKLIINKNLRDKDIIEGEYLGSVSPPSTSKQMTTQTITTTTPGVDSMTDDDTDIFKYILDSPDNESVEKHDINAHVNQYSYEINYSKIIYKNNNKSKHTDDSTEKDKQVYENFKTDNSEHSYKFHEAKDFKRNEPKTKHKQNFKHKKEKSSINDNEQYKADNTQHRVPVHDEMDIKYSIERTHYIYTSRKPEYEKKYYEPTTSTLPPEIIKKIAEDVKAMILKDLKRKTTTMLPVTVDKGLDVLIPRYNADQSLIPRYSAGQNLNPKYNLEQNYNTRYNPAQHLNPRYNAGQNMAKPYPLTKILDILQKYRNGDNLSMYRKPSEAAPIYTTTKRPQYPNMYPYYLPLESKPLKYDNNSPYINPYNLYKFAQSKKMSPRLKLEAQNTKPVPKKDSPPIKSYHSSNNFKSTPITLQTNLIEIPPIGVPISEPLAFLNHHVIISTRRPFRNKQRNPNKNVKTKNSKAIKHKPVRTRNTNPRINKNSYEVYYNKKIQADKKSDVDESREIKLTKSRDVYRPRVQNNIKKFHEELEKYSNTKNKAVNEDCCKDEIFTSEQLAGDEVRSRDEVSFRNLLKTQQKVTDMLTQMLVKRKNQDFPLSVEAA